MYKRIIKNIICVVILLNLFLPICYAQSEGIIDAIHKIMQSSKKDIAEDVNRNIDENFGQLDQRIMDNNKSLFRRSVFALIGGLTVVIFVYAYVQNKISRRYDIHFYEKMMDSKIEKLKVLPRAIESKSYYTSVTNPQFDSRYISNDKYFESFTDNEEFNNLRKEIEHLKKQLEEKKEVEVKEEPKKGKFNLSKKTKVVISIIIIVIGLLLLLYFTLGRYVIIPMLNSTTQVI